jgi:hypothetical protein
LILVDDTLPAVAGFTSTRTSLINRAGTLIFFFGKNLLAHANGGNNFVVIKQRLPKTKVRPRHPGVHLHKARARVASGQASGLVC